MTRTFWSSTEYAFHSTLSVDGLPQRAKLVHKAEARNVDDSRSLQLIILVCPSPGLFHRVLGFVLVHFGIDDLIFIQFQPVQHIPAIDQHIGQFFPDPGYIILRIAPLKTLQQFVGLNGNRLGQIGRRMELIPVPVF